MVLFRCMKLTSDTRNTNDWQELFEISCAGQKQILKERITFKKYHTETKEFFLYQIFAVLLYAKAVTCSSSITNRFL